MASLGAAAATTDCPICNKAVVGRWLRYHQMKCHRDLSQTGNRLLDTLITFIRSNGDYSRVGADVGQLIPCLHATGWSVEHLCDTLESLVDDGVIIKLDEHRDHYKFNYYLERESEPAVGSSSSEEEDEEDDDE